MLFVDTDTQQGFIEHFGSNAIPNCPDIRENLMDLTAAAVRFGIPIASLVYSGLPDADKIPDTIADSNIQYFFRHDSIEKIDNEDFFKFVAEVNPRSIFVYGVPLDTSVAALLRDVKDFAPQIRLVDDAVKGYSANPSDFDVKTIATYDVINLIKFKHDKGID